MWSRVCASSLAIVVGLSSASIFGCAATPEDPDSEELTEDVGTQGEGVSGTLPAGTELKATGNVNLRATASTSGNILKVIPNGSKVIVQTAQPKNGFYQVKHNGTVGWTYGQYYEPTGGSSGSVANGAVMTATADVNLREGPGTSYDVILVVPMGDSVNVADPAPQNGFYKVTYQGNTGWSSGQYYKQGDPSSQPNQPSEPSQPGGNTVIDAAMARAKSGVGFSYWWGHGRFKPEGPTSSTKGSCSGSCPNCSHSGSYGGDCSGLVAKVWQVPASNDDITEDSHPYSTADFVEDTSQWKTVARDKLKMADAMVYRSGGAGHIFIYSKGDGWGSMYAYECRGCSAGCIAGYRTASSSYHGIRRQGY